MDYASLSNKPGSLGKLYEKYKASGRRSMTFQDGREVEEFGDVATALRVQRLRRLQTLDRIENLKRIMAE